MAHHALRANGHGLAYDGAAAGIDPGRHAALRPVSAPAPWHALLAAIPPAVVPTRRPVASPEVLASPEGAAIAGWEQVSLELTAGGAGLRILLVILDASARPIAASDHVFYRHPADDPAAPGLIRQESIGGRLEADGTFTGTCWLVTGPEPPDEEPPRWESTPRTPTEAEVAALRSLVAELLARAP